MREEWKVRKKRVCKKKKHVNFYASGSEIKNVYFSNVMCVSLLMAYFKTNGHDHWLSNMCFFITRL
jgi:hypothetical protein